MPKAATLQVLQSNMLKYFASFSKKRNILRYICIFILAWIMFNPNTNTFKHIIS